MKTSITILILIFSMQIMAGDKIGNGGDSKRLIYSLFYYNFLEKNVDEDIALIPMPNEVLTERTDGVGITKLSDYVFAKDFPYSEKRLKLSKLIDDFNLFFTLDNKYNERNLRYDFNLFKNEIKTTFDIEENALSEIEVEITEFALYDNYENIVCARKNNYFEIIEINSTCLSTTSKTAIKYLIAHEIFRSLDMDDDNYYYTWLLFKSKMPKDFWTIY